MRKSTRIFILLAIIECLLIAGAVYMVLQVTSGNWNAPDPAETIRRIMTVTGAALPLVALPFFILAVSLRKKGE